MHTRVLEQAHANLCVDELSEVLSGMASKTRWRSGKRSHVFQIQLRTGFEQNGFRCNLLLGMLWAIMVGRVGTRTGLRGQRSRAGPCKQPLAYALLATNTHRYPRQVEGGSANARPG